MLKCHSLQKLFESKQKIYSFAWNDGFLFMADINKKLSVWKCEDFTSDCKRINSITLTENVGEILPLKFGSIVLVLLSVANGRLKVLRFNQETDEFSLMPSDIWQEEDFLPPTSLRIVDDNLIKNRSCRIIFAKGAYVVLSHLDLSHPALESIKIIGQQCIEVCHQKIITIEAMKSSKYFLVHCISDYSF